MLVYPQLESGALSQFPVLKNRRTRTVINRAADGSTIRLTDPAAETTEWQLTYVDLSDSEAATLRAFFDCAEGSLNGFCFLDPTGNLLAWSERLDHEVWQKDPLLSLGDGIADPVSGTAAWRLSNSGGGEQSIGQTIAGPGAYQYCFSAYVRSDSPANVTMSIAGRATSRAVGREWSRVWVTANGEADGTSVRFALGIAAGSAVEAFGIQVEAQCAASGYKASTRGGVYEAAHLGEDVLTISRTGANRQSCTVTIIHAKHL